MTRGRKPLIDRPAKVEVSIPETVLARVTLALMNPITGERRKGAISTLVTSLLREWLEKQTVGE